MQELKPIKEGKVREIYDNGDSLIMVATDRISCFDVILNNEVTKKGTVLTQMSKFWFDMTEDILPNHMISVDTKDMPEFFQQEKYEGKSMMCKKLNMLPIECIGAVLQPIWRRAGTFGMGKTDGNPVRSCIFPRVRYKDTTGDPACDGAEEL